MDLLVEGGSHGVNSRKDCYCAFYYKELSLRDVSRESSINQ